MRTFSHRKKQKCVSHICSVHTRYSLRQQGPPDYGVDDIYLEKCMYILFDLEKFMQIYQSKKNLIIHQNSVHIIIFVNAFVNGLKYLRGADNEAEKGPLLWVWVR